MTASVAFSCSSERAGSLRAFGRWTENDTRTFIRDITDAPSWLSSEVSRNARDLGQSFTFAMSKTNHDLRTGKELIVDSPAWLARETKRDVSRLRGTLSSTGDWTGQDARAFYEDVAGAPDYIARHAARELRDAKDQWKEIFRQFRDDVRYFPSHFWETVQILFIK